MKCTKRSHPPIKPAGLERADRDCIYRWTADEFRYPPYQYKSPYLIWTGGGRWRLISLRQNGNFSTGMVLIILLFVWRPLILNGHLKTLKMPAVA